MYKGRPTEAIIQLSHLSHNLEIAQSLHPTKTIIPVVKANAYGHGVIEVVRHLIEHHHVQYVAVAMLEEALYLRATFEKLGILIMGPLYIEDLMECSIRRFTVTVHDMDMFDAVMLFRNQLKVHVKVDTGMHRLGITPEEAVNVIEVLQKNPKIIVEGVYSHFASSHEDEAFTQMQITRFETMLEQLTFKPNMIHLSNTSAIFRCEQALPFTTHMRLGLGLYGHNLAIDPTLKPVMSLKSQIMQIKHLKPKDGLGYGQTYTAKTEERIGVVPIGYADGFIRKNKQGYVLIHNRRYPIVGIICMDMLFVKIDDSVSKYDEVIFFNETLPLSEVAKRLNTIPYEVLTNISSRVKRTYIKEEIR